MSISSDTCAASKFVQYLQIFQTLCDIPLHRVNHQSAISESFRILCGTTTFFLSRWYVNLAGGADRSACHHTRHLRETVSFWYVRCRYFCRDHTIRRKNLVAKSFCPFQTIRFWDLDLVKKIPSNFVIANHKSIVVLLVTLYTYI